MQQEMKQVRPKSLPAPLRVVADALCTAEVVHRFCGWTIETVEGNGLGNSRVYITRQRPEGLDEGEHVEVEGFDLRKGDPLRIADKVSAVSRICARAVLADYDETIAIVQKGTIVIELPGNRWLIVEDIPPSPEEVRSVARMRKRLCEHLRTLDLAAADVWAG